MRVTITPGKLTGKIDAVSSKSYLHRMLLCAAMSDRETVIRLNCRSKDVDATIRCVEAMGATVSVQEGSLTVYPVVISEKSPRLNCGESGSTARFVLPMAAAVCGGGTLIGEGRLPARPFGAICTVMEENGCTFSSYSLPMTVTGPLKSGTYRIPANISSQYISALMMSLPLVDGDSEIVFTTEVESEGYLDITEEVMRTFGMSIEKTVTGYKIEGNRNYCSPGEVTAEGDWSNGAFWVAANAMGSEIAVGNLKADSLQRDRQIVLVADKLFSGEGELVIDGSDIPDIIPILAVMACKRIGRTRFVNCGRLRLKESDRLTTVATLICALGGSAIVDKDDLIVDGCGKLVGGEIDSFKDHRIVMSAAIAATICTESVTITNAQDVAKSYPEFFEDYRKLGKDDKIEYCE
ncbi:MAG: 3-phosphoshikimate 1-carboxyvinyltransferase [Lachnospiraceae bacterium]|nr:3-phosphoshikimate 1-carboxyvinyltransferase [Lachnospiraceae bacterium]